MSDFSAPGYKGFDNDDGKRLDEWIPGEGLPKGAGPNWNNDHTQVMPNIPDTMKRTVDFSTDPDRVWKTQVGGSHYKKYAIQPTEYIMKNNLSFCEGNVIKYVTRYKDKNGIEDLKKARHYLDILIEELEKNGR